MISLTNHELAIKLGEILIKNKLLCAVAESCTGGGLAYQITEIPGCSNWFDRGFVTYTNNAKIEMLGVLPELITSFGAVSKAVALAMAEGALTNSNADITVSITGIAGPQGGTKDKPVGTVWIGWAGKTFAPYAHLFTLKGNRQQIRERAIALALEELINNQQSSATYIV